jgi:phage tail-like protein
MRNLDFHHLRGKWSWLRCDHYRTAIDPATEAVVLEPDGSEAAAAIDPWLERRGGGVLENCPPGSCEQGPVAVVSSPGEGLVRVRRGQEEPWERNRDGWSKQIRAIERGPHNRLFLLDLQQGRVLVLRGHDGRMIGATGWPGEAVIDLAACRSGLVAISRTGRRMWFQPYGGEWRSLAVDDQLTRAEPVAVDATPSGPAFVLWRTLEEPGGAVIVVDDSRCEYVELADASREEDDGNQIISAPAHILALSAERVLVSDITKVAHKRVRLIELVLGDGGLQPVGVRRAKAFDGRALLAGDDGETAFATTRRGLQRVHAARANYVTRGVLETGALDSERYGCQWHRIFIDACVPKGCSIEVQARCADEPYPGAQVPKMRAPAGFGEAATTMGDTIAAVSAGTQRPPSLRPGSRVLSGSPDERDENGWVPVGKLHPRRPHADEPLPPRLTTRQADDPLERRESPDQGVNFQTLEGLLKNEPGRFLWLRITLRGTRYKTPRLLGVRATYPRPSMLELLPAFWQADSAQARQLDHLMSLFEGEFTEFDDRLAALPYLFDPRLAPDGMLAWLASFVGLALDKRLETCVQRQLLIEAVDLYKKRGTIPGIRRLAQIISGTQVRIVEAFRARRRVMPVLGGGPDTSTDPVLGGGFELGSTTRPGLEHDQADEPGVHPSIAFHRDHAHRFTVVLAGPHDRQMLPVLDDAIEAYKPAHTLHEICGVDDGFITGVNTFVGVGTRLGESDEPQPSVLGQTSLGTEFTLHESPPSEALGTFVGASRIGQSTNLG